MPKPKINILAEAPIDEALKKAGAKKAFFATAHPSDLIPDEQNPRIHTDEHVEEIADSMKKAGFIGTMSVNKEGKILAGHGRQKAAILAGLKSVNLVVIHGMTREQEIAFNIGDNKLTEKADWDNDLLRSIFKNFRENDVDLSGTGFEDLEVDLLINEWDSDIEAITKITGLIKRNKIEANIA